MSFLLARRLRACAGLCTDEHGERFTWSMLDAGTDCPRCQVRGIRPYRRFFLRAGRRGGKTRIGALSAIEECTVPYSAGWCCAPSYPELEDYVLPAFFSQLPSDWFDHPATEWSEDRLSLVLPNKAQVHFRSLDDPNRGTGPGLDWLWIDEARKIQELAWDIIRPALTEKKGIAFLTSSPEWGEDWTHKRFFQPAEEGRPGFWATTFRTVDNPIIDPEEVEEARQTMPPELFRREYEASIEYPTGTIYGEHLNGCDADDDEIRKFLPEWPRIDSSRPSIVGMDPGTDHPFASTLLVVTPMGLVVAGEYCERNKTFSQHAISLKAMIGPLEPRWGVDRSAKQAAIELAQHGIYASTTGLGGPGSVAAGIQRVFAWMAKGKLKIARSKCPRLLKELRNYRWAELQENPKGLPKDAIPFKKGDDLCFVAGTRISTEHGAVAIEQIHAGMCVWTRSGLRRVLAAGCTGTRPVQQIDLDDGRALIGTPNHPIWVEGRGFTPLDVLRYGDIVPRWLDFAVAGTASGSIATPTRRIARIASIGSRISARVGAVCRRFTKKSGKPRTVGFLAGTISIIGTAIRSIIGSEISKPSQKRRIVAITTEENPLLSRIADTWAAFVRWRLAGIDLPLAGAGIEYTDVQHGRIELLSPSSVTPAGVDSDRGRSATYASVAMPANRRGDGRLSGISKSGAVRSAVNRFLSRNSRRFVPALVGAARVCASFPAGIAPVYNLTVAETPEYFANGCLVHNCDALRYSVMLWPELPVEVLAPFGIRENKDLNHGPEHLVAKFKSEIERNRADEKVEDGLVRVTDDFTVQFAEERPLGDSIMADFYR